ncbi:MinD/ParA family protein [Mycolicibacterium sp. HK-90]|uniref:MinD/ParA family ATP-binding protein n=1 Tax=Mycolicibacterium sp. HK-90 TaxID=3056937 RepID=UPI0026589D3D|nr:AAA family ATPase [Mycolicibacterium sp. HK-90]WKG06416.1 AAA family ATPase [Mycolicibacterium sp. HK-90]
MEPPLVPSVFAPVPGFRSQQRFSNPAEPGVSTPLPAEWTAPTPPHGIPVIAAPPVPGAFDRPVAAGLQVPAAAPAFGGPVAAPPAAGGVERPGAGAVERPAAGDFATPYRDLSTDALLGQRKNPPTSGWRKALYVASFKQINVGESPKTTHHNSLVAEVSQPLQGCYRIALMSLKGGVGKTTITATLGATFASIRGDRVVAVDANPDRGTLSQKVPLETAATVRHLLRDAEGIERYSDVRAYTSQGPSRLEVLASESDPAVSEAFSSDDYLRALEVLERFYSLVLTDCGTGLMHSAMSAVLSKADVLVVISSGSVDGARSASATLDWLDAHGHQDLVRNSIAVINAVRPRSGKVDLSKVVDHFSRRCRAVRLVPFDPHLEEGAEISLDRLKPGTREALIELAAVVASDFAAARRSVDPRLT